MFSKTRLSHLLYTYFIKFSQNYEKIIYYSYSIKELK